MIFSSGLRQTFGVAHLPAKSLQESAPLYGDPYRAIRTAMLRRKLTMCQISSSVMRPSQASMS